jgi:hypothetical protein
MKPWSGLATQRNPAVTARSPGLTRRDLIESARRAGLVTGHTQPWEIRGDEDRVSQSSASAPGMLALRPHVSHPSGDLDHGADGRIVGIAALRKCPEA